MKTKLLLIVLFICQPALPQKELKKVILQNFYTACKAENYRAYTFLNTGKQLLETNQYGRSMRKFQKALAKDSALCDAYYLIGYCHQQRGEYQQALEACDMSIQKNDQNPSAYSIKANTMLYLNDTTKAYHAFQKARKLDTVHVDGYYGMALIAYWQKEYDKAKSILREFDKNSSTDNIFYRKDKKKLEALMEKLDMEE